MNHQNYQRQIIAYHGCDQSVVEKVLLSRENLKPSQKEYDWLGHGIYFWENGPARALEWAQSKEKIKHPATLGAIINLTECLDLLDLKHCKILEKMYPQFEEHCRLSGQTIPENENPRSTGEDFLLRKKDCAVINWTLENYVGQKFKTVRGVFQESTTVFPDSGIRSKSHIQIAVRDPSCIIGYFLPNSS